VKKVLVIGSGILAVFVVLAMANDAIERDYDYQRLMRRGDEALASGQSSVAIDAFTAAITKKPGAMLAYLKRGEAQRKSGDSQKTLLLALRDLRIAASLDPGAPRVHEDVGDVNFQLKRYRNAIESYQSYLRLDDRSAAIYYKLALAWRADGQLAKAISTLRDALKLNPAFAEAHYMLGLCIRERGQIVEARREFERAINIAPALIPAREELAALHELQGQTREQIDQLEAIAALDPNRPERSIAVGLAFARAGNPEYGVTTLSRAAARFHDSAAVTTALGQVWLAAAEDHDDTEALNKALETLEPLAAANAAPSETLGLYARALLLKGEVDEAEATYSRAAQTVPTDPDVLNEFAALAQQRGHFDEARGALTKYLVIVDDDHDFSLHAAKIGDLSMALNEPASAVSWYEQAEVSGPSDASLLARLADAQLKSGRQESAVVTIARATAKDPDSPLVRSVALRIQRVSQSVTEKVKTEHQ